MNIKDYKLGAIESDTDLRDYDYSMIAGASKEGDIPESFKLDYKYPILDQGNISSCVAHALSEAKSYIDNVDLNNMYSIGFIYANRKEGDNEGKGLVTREALKNLVDDGNCFKNDFPVNEEYPEILNTLDEYGKEELFKKASEHKALAYLRLEPSEIKEYIFTQQKPVILCIKIYSNLYDSMLNGGKIPSIPKGERKGSHAVICIGFNKDELILINSWNEKNGDQGKFYLDVNSEIIRECWVLEDKKNLILPPTDPKAKYKIGWNKSKYNGKWFYSTDGNECYYDSWQQIKGVWYCFDKEGYAIENNWTLYKGKWYFLEKDSCAMETDKWILWNEKWYRLGKDGAMVTGWYQDINGKWYYLDIDKGYCYTDCNILIDGKYYRFDKSGAWIENTKFKGIDISNHNGNINFEKVKADGVECVYIKATEGTTFVDNYLDKNYCGAKQAGLKTGFYHFLVGTSSPETQAYNFYNQIKDKQSDLIPCLDVETAFSSLMDYALRFINKFKELSNMNICIYTYTGFMNNLDSRLADYLLWEANYNNDPWNLPSNNIWNSKLGHQYTEKGRIDGIDTNVDLNEFTQDVLI